MHRDVVSWPRNGHPVEEVGHRPDEKRLRVSSTLKATSSDSTTTTIDAQT